MKMSEKLQEIKKDNKGFSLVELIIVIAIMAILIGIVGMNVIPQIENANVATDAQILSAVVSEATEAWTQVDHASTDMTITVKYDDSTKKLTFTAKDGDDEGMATKVANQMKELEDSTRTFKSKAVKTAITSGMDITFNTTDGVKLDASSCTKLDGYDFTSR